MKIKVAFLSLMIVSASQVVSAQVEHDDMYFNSKDRAKVQASRPMTLSMSNNSTNSITSQHEVATAINPTDSYSARNVNPEYISQSKVSSGSSEPAPYFIPDYTPTSVNQNLKGNNSSYSGYNNAYYPYNNGMYSGFGNPYYNGYYPSSMYSGYGYNPYGFNSFYNSGWSSMLTLGFGMGGYPYGGMGGYYPYGGSSWAMGMMGMYGSPYYGWNSFYNMGMGYGYGYYPHTVVVINDVNRNNNVIYGRRPSRSSDINNTVTYDNRSTAMVTDSQGRVRSAGSNGRVSGDGTTSYYQRGWRTNPETNSAVRSNWSTSGRTGGTDNSSGFRSNSGYNSRSNNSSFFDNGGSRSSNFSGGGSNFSSGGGSRSSGSVGGGSSSGVRRGRD
jgi:hypothetical protein